MSKRKQIRKENQDQKGDENAVIFPNQITTNLRDDNALEIYIDNKIVAEIADGKNDPAFIDDVLIGMGYKIFDKDDLTKRAMTEEEDKYTFAQCSDIAGRTGLIGYLRADFDRDGNGFFSTWNDILPSIKTDDFKQELDAVINSLREEGDILHDRNTLRRYCYSTPQSKMTDERDYYGVRVDTEHYTYLLRLNPNKGEYNLYCYCYTKDKLDTHIRKARKGIRFIDPNYKEKFRITDGDLIRITHPDGKQNIRPCRYIDDYHVEVGRTVYHICEFAERMEQNGNKVIPLRSDLPECCYVYVQTCNVIGIVKKGETGYYPTDIIASTHEEMKALVDEANKNLRVTKAQAAAMFCGSICGFDVPGADPKCYDVQGHLINPRKRDRGDAR